MEINRALRGLPTVVRRAGKLGEITVSIPITFKITRLKYHGNKPSLPAAAGKLGEIIQIRINYFTERSAVYFYSISIVFQNGYFNTV